MGISTMKIIKYTIKQTNANTEYIQLDQQDTVWLKNELMRILSLMGELHVVNNHDLQQIINSWWTKKQRNLPKGRHGLNTPQSFISGLINNTMFGTQYNLSTQVLESLEIISIHIHNLEEALSDFDKIKITKGEPFKFQLSFETIIIPKH